MNKNTKFLLAAIIGLSVIFRIMAAFFLGDQVVNLPGTYDQISYHTLALRVLNGYGFTFGQMWWPITQPGAPTAHWSFLYTFYLIIVYAIFGPHPLIARILQAVIVGVLQPILIYKIGYFLFNETVGLISAFLTAFYVYFIYYSATLMTEPFYIMVILVALYLILKITALSPGKSAGPKLTFQELRLSALMGLATALAILFRQLFFLFVPFIILWIWWLRRGRKGNLFMALIPICIILMVILPFTVFNYTRFHRFVLLNTNAGYAFFWANHPIYGIHFEPILPKEMGTYQDLIPTELLKLDEAALDQALLKLGIRFIIDDPVRYLLLSISRIPAFFMFWPSRDSELISNISRVFSFGLLWPFMLYGLFCFPQHRPANQRLGMSSPVILLLLFCLIYTLIHLFSWSLIRYRLPVDAVLLIFAAVAISDLAQRLKISLPLIQKSN